VTSISLSEVAAVTINLPPSPDVCHIEAGMIVDDVESDIETLRDVLNGVIAGGLIASREDVPFLKGRFPGIHGSGDLRETPQERGCAEGQGMGCLNVSLALLRQWGGDLGDLLHESHCIAPVFR